MVKGRRKRAPTSGSVHTRSSALNGAVGPVVSPLRKESKLDIGTRLTNKTPDMARSSTRIDKTAVRITSFFSTQENGISGIKLLGGMQATELFLEKEHFNVDSIKAEVAEDDNSPMKEFFKTDGSYSVLLSAGGLLQVRERRLKLPKANFSLMVDLQERLTAEFGDAVNLSRVPSRISILVEKCTKLCYIDTAYTDKSHAKPVEILKKSEALCSAQPPTLQTPVAVPCRDPPTPHRINMPNIQMDEADIKLLNGDVEKKPVGLTLSPIQRVERKRGGRARGKLKTNSSSSPRTLDAPLDGNANHKVTEYFPVRRSVRKCKKTVLEEKQRDLENKVVCQVEDGLQVKHFAGKGRGVVTTQEFPKGEFVVEYIGDLIDQVTAKKREAIYAQDQNTGCYMYYFQHRGHQYCVDATAETEKLGRLVNHSRNGNLIARVVEVGTIPHLVLTAKEDIPVGVEVTYDYGDRSREAIRNHPWLAL